MEVELGVRLEQEAEADLDLARRKRKVAVAVGDGSKRRVVIERRRNDSARGGVPDDVAGVVTPVTFWWLKML